MGIKNKTVLIYSSQKKKESIFSNINVLRKFSKNITSYAFLLIFKIVKQVWVHQNNS